MQVQDLGEQGLLKRLRRFCPIEFMGDDAALLTPAADHALVVTTDLLVDGIHFSDQTTTPADAGWRAAAANLSDLAAMGANPLGLTIGLALPGALSVEWVEQLYQGIVDCLQPYQTPIVGGDICRAVTPTIAITAFGQVLPDRVIRRSTAQPGDVILVTGSHGASRAGLELLLQPTQGQALSAADRAQLIQAHQRPQPRLDAIHQPALRSARRPPAGMDSSDGLADAVLQICRASRVGAQLERNLIPFPACLTAWVSEAQAIEWALYGGEDFELVLCLPRSDAQALLDQLQQLGSQARIIGTIIPEPIVYLRDSSHIYPDEILTLEQSFQHFQSPASA
ncbi:MAG: thiamine-phosphate kinase [Elainella sp. Prado103]|nr:thiamine-phosphate kinase [Elainella sp. Prado103]